MTEGPESLKELMRIVPRCEIVVSGKQCKSAGYHHVRVTKGADSMEVDVCRVHIDRFTRHATDRGATVLRLHEWGTA